MFVEFLQPYLITTIGSVGILANTGLNVSKVNLTYVKSASPAWGGQSRKYTRLNRHFLVAVFL